MEKLEVVTDFNLAIGIPLTSRQEYTDFWDSFHRMDKPIEYHYLRPGFPVDENYRNGVADVRNDICERALDVGCTHLWMIDSDQIYPQHSLVNLWRYASLPVVCGKVHRRYEPFDPILYRFDEEKQKYYMIPDEEWVGKDHLLEVDATGAACMLIRLDVLENVPYPWFKNLREGDTTIGEDVYFCRGVRRAGYKVYVDLSVKVGHLTLMEVNENFYLLYKHLAKLNAANGGQKNG